MKISEKIKNIEDQIKSWDESGLSSTLAPWHCGLGQPDNKSRYQQALDELKYLRGLIDDHI